MENIICKLCGKGFNHLGSHLWHAHKITAREYKEQFGLDYKFPLISKEVKIKKQEAFEIAREKYLKNLQGGKDFRFKKGITNKKRISEQSHNRYLDNLSLDKRGKCPICKTKFDHVASHLYNKHALVIARK